MRWSRTGGGDIEDRRGMGVGKVAGGGLGLIGIVLSLLFGGGVLGGDGAGFDVDTGPQLPGMPSGSGTKPGLDGAPDPDQDLKDFMGFVVDNVQDSWEQAFQRAGQTYQRTTLVLFEDAVSTGCGQASSATGPFYCPADSKMYLDFGFFRELASDRFGAPGDFAQAYVIAHEVGHHVQHLLGISDQVARAEQRRPADANELSVRVELQADCFAGVWGHSAYRQQLLEDGDLQEGLDAASAVGDDRLQAQATGQVNPERFTHGTSAQRMKWFRRGFESGDSDRCDTYSGGI